MALEIRAGNESGGGDRPFHEGGPHAPAEGSFAADLPAWYALRGRHDLPWRVTRDAYRVLVSEVMLQQTQVARVAPFYEQWVARWPNPGRLASASRADVIRAWGGLGYNRRAVRLHEAARAVVAEHGGEVPLAVEELERLPGVGSYTARAVACFAGEICAPVLDANTKRVLARHRLGVARADGTRNRALEAAAVAVLPCDRARDHNLALMDLGALVCRAARPSCDACPLRATCAWSSAGYPATERVPRRAGLRFEETARYARGRIIAALRGSDVLSTAEVGACLPDSHRPLLLAHLDRLRAEGLIEQRLDGWCLSEEEGIRG